MEVSYDKCTLRESFDENIEDLIDNARDMEEAIRLAQCCETESDLVANLKDARAAAESVLRSILEILPE